jgi:hypothetical protein
MPQKPVRPANVRPASTNPAIPRKPGCTSTPKADTGHNKTASGDLNLTHDLDGLALVLDSGQASVPPRLDPAFKHMNLCARHGRRKARNARLSVPKPMACGICSFP